MKMPRILIVEDEPLVAAELEMIVADFVAAAIMIEVSVAASKEVLNEGFDFAFLDIDVTNGKTFELARMLECKQVPFAFVSGSDQNQLPVELHGAPFISKPFCAAQARFGGCSKRTTTEVGLGRILNRRQPTRRR